MTPERLANLTRDELIAEVERLQRELAAVREDGERYRFLRDDAGCRFEIMAEITPDGDEFFTGRHDLDAAIDAARKQETHNAT